MSERAETGPMRFGDDWAGVFVRGDNAIPIVLGMKEIDGLKEQLSFTGQMALSRIKSIFCGDHIEGGGKSAKAQQLKSFDQCAGQSMQWVKDAPEGAVLLSRLHFGLHNPAVSTVVEVYPGGLLRLLEGQKHFAVIQLQQLGIDAKDDGT